MVDSPVQGLGDAETEQITSVIFGLLRQNSFTFLEVLEGARFVVLFFTFDVWFVLPPAIMTTIRERETRL